MRLELASAALARVAHWPIQTLDAFGARDAPELAGSREAYAGALDRERAELWRFFASDERFKKALFLSSPQLSARLEPLSLRAGGTRTKRVRHGETSLYRYLARAAGRATPFGLWAGAGIVDFGKQDRIRRNDQVSYRVAPRLAPFQAMLRELGQRAEYRSTARFRANPTLSCSGALWSYVARLANGQLDARVFDAEPALDAIVGRLIAHGAAPLAVLAEETQANGALVEALARGGALVGGLDLPGRFTSPWDALARAAEALRGEDRPAWSACIGELRAIASSLEAELERMPLRAIGERLNRAKASIQRLAGELMIELAGVGHSPLVVDSGLPLSFSLGERTRAELERQLEAYELEWLEAESPASAWRAERRRARLAALERAGLTLAEALACDPAGAASSVRPFPMPAPVSSLFVRLLEGEPPRILGTDDNPLRPFARYAPLFGDGNALSGWMRERLASLSRAHAVAWGELVVPFESNPNVLARPDWIDGVAIAPYGAADGPSLAGARFERRGDAIFLRVPSLDRPVAVLSPSAASVLASDPLVERLLWTSFEERLPSDFRAAGQAGIEQPGVTDPVRLSTGACLRGRRAILEAGETAALSRLPPFERFVAFTRLAQDAQLARMISFQLPGHAPLLVPRTSPLALEAAFEGARHVTGSLVLEDASETPWLEDSEGGRYTAELAVPFARSLHAWLP